MASANESNVMASFDIDETINAYFVTTSATVTSSAEDDMSTALTYLRNHIPENNIRLIKASEGFPLIASGQLSKKDVFVFDKFDGDLFKQLQQTKCLIVGPRCLSDCVLKCEPIPLGSSPIFTTAMRDLQICATGITLPEKERISTLIGWMGGYYFQNFGRSVTHLVSNTIKSKKYEHATLTGIPVMHVDWVQRVWERSCVSNVSATDNEFNTYRLPIFFGTNITCSGLETDKKNEVMRLVDENGGTYHRAFRSQLVDILITEKSKTDTEKYKAAVRYKKDVLLPEWIIDSVEKGFALPTKAYLVKALKVSTPTRTDQSIADFTCTDQTHFSDISHISIARSKTNKRMLTENETICSTVNETQQENFTAPAAKQSINTLSGAGAADYRLVYDEICPRQAKKAGNFLDGCCIYLSGFRIDEREKLNRILNVGGATRYDVVNEKITHIIVGEINSSELRTWKMDGLFKTVNIVRLIWLLESIALKQPANVSKYRISLPTSNDPDAPSPSSKRTLRSMNHSFKQPVIPSKKKLFTVKETTSENAFQQASPVATSTELPIEDVTEEQNLISQYSQENMSNAELPPQPAQLTKQQQSKNAARLVQSAPSSAAAAAAPPTKPPQSNPSELSSTGMSVTIDYENLNCFQGLSVYVDKDNFPDEIYTQLLSECQAAMGSIVCSTYRDIVDYAIVSFECTLNETLLPVKARNIITELYLESCLKENKLVPIEYYHKHIPHTADAEPLRGMTIVISTYTEFERDFIQSIAQLLGANVKKTLVRKDRPLLVCPLPEGSKYEGSIKWGYPVVVSEWLVQCAVTGAKLPFQKYLVGASPENFPGAPNSSVLVERNAENVSLVRLPPAEIPEPMNVSAVENHAQFVVTPLRESNDLAADFTPLRNKRVSELAAPARSAGRNSISTPEHVSTSSPDSPHTPTTGTEPRASYNFEFLEGICAEIQNDGQRQCMREMIEHLRNNPTPELERIRRQACTPRRVPTPTGVPEFCTTPAFQKRMADEFEKRWRLPMRDITPDTPLDVLRRRVLRATCKAQGIPWTDDEDDDNVNAVKPTSTLNSKQLNTIDTVHTPPVDQSISRNLSMNPRALFSNRKSPNNEQNSRISDAFVPCTQSPNASEHRGQHVSLGKSTINFDKISFEDTTVSGLSTHKNNHLLTTVSPVVSPEIKKITEYLKDCETRRQSMKRSATRNSAQQVKGSQELMETETQYVQPFESEQFGVGTEEMVGWRDPVEFSMERRSKTVSTMQFKGKPCFSISCVDDGIRLSVAQKIVQLGGTVSAKFDSFDPLCTHFVCERPNRGEKILGCISSGKWVLSLKYVEECHAKDVFIDEELYEWGNCKALNLPQLTPDEQTVAQAAHRWRKSLAAKRNDGQEVGAFTGVSAILRITDKTLNALRNVIRAGNGVVIDAKSPYSYQNSANNATHCFVDVKNLPLPRGDYDFLATHNVRMLTYMYINAYLMQGSDGNFAKYEIKM